MRNGEAGEAAGNDRERACWKVSVEVGGRSICQIEVTDRKC